MKIFNSSPSSFASQDATTSDARKDPKTQGSDIGLSSRSSSHGSAAPRQSLFKTLKNDAKAFGQYVIKGDKESKAATAALKQSVATPFKQVGQKMTELKDGAKAFGQDMKDFGQYIRHGDKESKAAMASLLNTQLHSSSQVDVQGDSSSPASGRAQLFKTLKLPDTLSESHVAERMSSSSGRDALKGELEGLIQQVGEQAKHLLDNSWRQSSMDKIDRASEQLLTELHGMRDELMVLNQADVPASQRSQSLQKMGIESPISLAYVEANATTPEGVARMKKELEGFDAALRLSYKKGQAQLHPDKVMQRTGASKPDDAAVQKFDAFREAHATLQDMSSGLHSRLDQLSTRQASKP